VEDSLELARQRYPGQRNSLDALCKRLGVDNAHRHLHGALLDAQLLVDVYLALTAGQGEIGFAAPHAGEVRRRASTETMLPAADASMRARVSPSEEELAAHAARLEEIRKKTKSGVCVWDAAS
jgi:DNA polymerase-3 subunit epsilon